MGNPEFKISVVIPTYNSSQFLERTLASVLAQSFPVYEVVVVDDCSNDNTVAVARDTLSEFDVIFKILQNKKNMGASVTREKGVAASQGSYIAFLDSDDEWEHDHIKTLVSVFDTDPTVSFAFSQYTVFINNKVAYISPACERLSFRSALTKTVVATPSVMVKRSHLPDSWVRRRTGQDYWLWLTLLNNYGEARCSGSATVRVHLRSNSLSSNKLQNIADVWQVQKLFGVSKFGRFVNIQRYLMRVILKVIRMRLA